MKVKKIMAIFAAASVMLAGCGTGSASTTVTEETKTTEASGTQTEAVESGENKAPDDTSGKKVIKIGSILALGTATPFVATEKGFFDESGISIEVTEFSDGSALMEAFAAGELDIALSGIIPVATWVSKGVDMQVVAGANGGGHVLMTRKETGIKSVEDLKGHSIAEPNIATVTDALLRSKILGDAAIDPEKDVTLIPGMKPADMATVLMATKEVDAMITWEPFASQAEQEYGDEIQIVYDAPKEIMEAAGSESFYPGNVVVASKEFIENSTEDLNKFLDVYKKTVDFINNDESANAVLAKVLNLDEAVIENARKRTDYHYEIDQEGSMDILQWAADLEYIDGLPEKTELFWQG